jgi:hypothetical protein
LTKIQCPLIFRYLSSYLTVSLSAYLE